MKTIEAYYLAKLILLCVSCGMTVLVLVDMIARYIAQSVRIKRAVQRKKENERS